MTIAGFTFSRIYAEKGRQARGQVNINTNIALLNAEEIDFVMGASKQNGLKIMFEYKNAYSLDIGTLVINGDILYLSDQKKHDELLKGWKKDKKFPDDVTAELYDMISVRSTVQAVQLASAVGLPPPIPLPRFKAAPAQAPKAKK